LDLKDKKRSLGLFDVYGESLSILGKRPGYFLGVAFVWQVVIQVWEFGTTHLLPGIAGVIVNFLGAMVFSPFFSGTLVLGALLTIDGHTPDPRDVMSQVANKFGKLFLLNMGVTVAVSIGFLFFLVPGIYLMSIWAFWMPLALLDKGAGRTLTTSEEMAAGCVLDIALVRLTPFVALLVFGLPFLLFRKSFPSSFPWKFWYAMTAGVFLGALLEILIAVIYKRVSKAEPGVLAS
jgi:hypothetical protein